jgi:oxygen-dependent protoporphyrinogen oxidase
MAVREWRADGGPHPLGGRRFTVRAGGRSIEADALVLAGPSPVSADLLRSVDAPLAEQLDRVDAAPLAVVCLGYNEAALAADRGPLDGFGFLVPRDEGTRILGALWESTIYAGRAPAGKALVRVMIGGATDPAAVRLDDAELVLSVRAGLERTMGLRIAPEFVRVVRHRRGIPQYTVGHLARLAHIDRLLDRHPGLFLAGNSYRGVSINACIADASGLAVRVADHVRMTQHASPRAAALR